MAEKHKYITYRPKTNTYQVCIRVTDNGKRRSVTRQAKTLEEALMLRSELLRQYNLSSDMLVHSLAPLDVDAPAPSMKQAFERYIAEDLEASGELKAASLYRWKLTAKRYAPIFGSMPITRITSDMVQDVFTAWQNKLSLTKDYLVAISWQFRRVMAYYVDKGILEHNVFDRSLKLKRTRRKKERHVYTEGEERLILHYAKERGFIWYLLFALYFQTGARRGEIVALKWQDIDFVNKCLHISHAIERDGSQEIYGTPKTPQSCRAVPLKDKMVAMLQAWKNATYTVYGTDFVFPAQQRSHSSHPWLAASSVSGVFREIADKAGLTGEGCDVHAIRHTVATRLVLAGVPLPTVQRIGGWSSYRVLLSVYAHTSDKSMRDAINTM